MVSTEQVPPIKHPVVVGFDHSTGGGKAVGWAAREAQRRGRPLLIVHAFEWTPPVMAQGWSGMAWTGHEQVRELASERLAALAEQCRAERPGLEVHATMPDGSPERALPAIVEEHEAQLLVLGSSGLSALPRALLGSTASELVRTASVPAVVVRGGPDGDAAEPTDTGDGSVLGQGPVVVGADGSPASDPAVDFAFDFAALHRLPLRAVHAWSDSPLDLMEPAHTGEPRSDMNDEDRPAYRQIADRRQAHPDVPVHWERVDDRPAHALLANAEDATLLVVGSHGRGPLRRALLGSVSHAVLYHAPCPVAVLRAPGADSD
jgi:nucleotide-binding universal stress UspA family protein